MILTQFDDDDDDDDNDVDDNDENDDDSTMYLKNIQFSYNNVDILKLLTL